MIASEYRNKCNNPLTQYDGTKVTKVSTSSIKQVMIEALCLSIINGYLALYLLFEWEQTDYLLQLLCRVVYFKS
uniref:Uncharacterized protein n=1 Tax=Pararge aegeria TaxID=116150 RepID=S4NWA9_9NEOP